MQKKLFIISNESIFYSQNSFFCDNLDMKSTPEGLEKSFDINIIARRSKKERAHKINIKNINIYNNILSFLFSIFRSLKVNNCKYLLISITPFTFLHALCLHFLEKNLSFF